KSILGEHWGPPTTLYWASRRNREGGGHDRAWPGRSAAGWPRRSRGSRSLRLVRSWRTMRQVWLGQLFMFLMAVLTLSEHRHDGLSVERDSHYGAVEDQTDNRFLGQQAGFQASQSPFCPLLRPAHRILADGTAEDPGERSAHAMAR